MKTLEPRPPQSEVLGLLTAAAQEFFLQIAFEPTDAQQLAFVIIPRPPAGDRAQNEISFLNAPPAAA